MSLPKKKYLLKVWTGQRFIAVDLYLDANERISIENVIEKPGSWFGTTDSDGTFNRFSTNHVQSYSLREQNDEAP